MKTNSRLRAGFAGLALLMSPAPLLAADSVTVPVTPGLSGWQEITFSDFTPNRWGVEDGALTVESDRGSSVLYAAVSADPAQTPMLRWRWRVDAAPAPTDLTRKGGDDRALSLTVGFAYEPEKASFGERMKRMLVETAAGSDAPGRIIALVWGGPLASPDLQPHPYSGDSGAQLFLRAATAPTGAWVEQEVDLAALYRARFGSEPPRVVNLAISSDGDDTGTNVRARIADIRFGTR